MGNPFVHIELSADDVAAAKKFYKSVFDWKLTDVPGPYTMIEVGKGGAGGGMAGKQMPNQPTAWLAYVEVADVKKSLEKAKAGGATIIVDYMPIGEMGAIGVFVDPQGAALGVWEKAKAAPKAAKKAAKKKPAKKKAAKKGKR
jgi:predicted enzyme related to lactoylglutathione lyase